MIINQIISLPYKIGREKFLTNKQTSEKDKIFFNFENLKSTYSKIENYLSSFGQFVHPTCEIEKNVTIQGNVYIDEGVKIYSGVKLSGNIYLGKNSVIYNNAIIRGNTSIGENSIVCFSTDIKNVIASNNFSVGPICFISDSFIGSNCFFGGVCRTGNYRFDKKSPSILIQNKLVSTNLEKFGLIVGDNTIFGMAVISMPGRIVGSGCQIGSHVQIMKNIESNKKVILKQNLEITDID